MLTAILVIVAIGCAFGWLIQYIASIAILLWAEEKGLVPDSAEIETHARNAWKAFLRIK